MGEKPRFIMCYFFEKEGEKVAVTKPYDFLVGCKACAQRCPTEAVSFPTREELK